MGLLLPEIKVLNVKNNEKSNKPEENTEEFLKTLLKNQLNINDVSVFANFNDVASKDDKG